MRFMVQKKVEGAATVTVLPDRRQLKAPVEFTYRTPEERTTKLLDAIDSIATPRASSGPTAG